MGTPGVAYAVRLHPGGELGGGARVRDLDFCSRERREMSGTGFGLSVTAGAVGGVSGSQVYGWLEARVGQTFLLRLVCPPWRPGTLLNSCEPAHCLRIH